MTQTQGPGGQAADMEPSITDHVKPASTLVEHLKDSAVRAADFIHTYPIVGILGGAALGFLIGRRRRPDR